MDHVDRIRDPTSRRIAVAPRRGASALCNLDDIEASARNEIDVLVSGLGRFELGPIYLRWEVLLLTDLQREGQQQDSIATWASHQLKAIALPFVAPQAAVPWIIAGTQ